MKNFNKFLNELEDNLYFFNQDEIDSIILDYKELYNAKINNGMSEEEIVQELDSPKKIANNYMSELDIKTSYTKKIIKKIKREINKINLDIKEKRTSINSEYIEQEKINKSNKILFYTKVLFLYLIKIINIIVRILLLSALIIVILGYLFSFIFLSVDINTFPIRLLETIITISSIVCIWMTYSFITKVSNE